MTLSPVPLAGLLTLGALLYAGLVFNRLVTLGNHIRDAWSNIDAELKRRHDLIPNLVAVVKGYAAHEREVLEHVAAWRTRCAASRGTPADQAADETGLVGALQHLLAVVERYPALKADAHFAALQRELVNTEDRIQAARRFYNGNVRDYRTQCERFPSLLVARLFRFQPVRFFDVPPAVRAAPQVPR